MSQICGDCVLCNRAESAAEAEWGITRYECGTKVMLAGSNQTNKWLDKRAKILPLYQLDD